MMSLMAGAMIPCIAHAQAVKPSVVILNELILPSIDADGTAFFSLTPPSHLSGSSRGRYRGHFILTLNTNFTQHSVTRVTTPIGQQVIVSRAYSSNSVEGLKMGASFYKGPPAALPIGTGETFNFARTLKGITRGIDAVEGQPAFSESTISMVFSMSETKVANMAGESVDDFLSRWRQNYENRGYVPLPME